LQQNAINIGAFAKWRKATIASSCLCACPTVLPQTTAQLQLDRYLEIWYIRIFGNLSKKTNYY